MYKYVNNFLMQNEKKKKNLTNVKKKPLLLLIDYQFSIILFI